MKRRIEKLRIAGIGLLKIPLLGQYKMPSKGQRQQYDDSKSFFCKLTPFFFFMRAPQSAKKSQKKINEATRVGVERPISILFVIAASFLTGHPRRIRYCMLQSKEKRVQFNYCISVI